MNYFAIALLALFIAVITYPFFTELCGTIRHCATARAIGKLNAQGMQIKPENVEEMICNEQPDRK